MKDIRGWLYDFEIGELYLPQPLVSSWVPSLLLKRQTGHLLQVLASELLFGKIKRKLLTRLTMHALIE